MFSFFYKLPYIFQSLIAGLFAFTLTSIGASVVFFFKKTNKHTVNCLLALSAGIMLAATFWSLLEPGIELATELNLIPAIIISIGVILGTIFLISSEKLLNKYQNNLNNNKIKKIVMIIIAITIHNIPEGLAIGVAFGALKYNITGVTYISALLLSLGIGIQNIPEGSSISLPLRSYGTSRKKSFLIGSLSGIVEPISAVLGTLLVTKVRLCLPFLLAFAAGAMLYVIIKELIPESSNDSDPKLITIITLVGFLLMMILDISIK